MEDFATTASTTTAADDDAQKCRLASFLLLCDSDRVDVDFITRSMKKPQWNILEDLRDDDRFWINEEEEGKVFCGLTHISDEDHVLRRHVEMWKLQMYKFLTKEMQNKSSVVAVCTLASSVNRPFPISRSIKVKDVLNSDAKRRFLTYTVGEKQSQLLVRVQLSDEEVTKLSYKWRENIIKFMLKKKFAVPISLLGSEVPKPKLLSNRMKLSETMRTDPFSRFVVHPETAFISLSTEYLRGHWRNLICKYMNSTQSFSLSLAVLGAAVPRPCTLSRTTGLLEVIRADPAQRLKICGQPAHPIIKLVRQTEWLRMPEEGPYEGGGGDPSPQRERSGNDEESSISINVPEEGWTLVAPKHTGTRPPQNTNPFTSTHSSQNGNQRSTFHATNDRTAKVFSFGSSSNGESHPHDRQQRQSQQSQSRFDTEHQADHEWFTGEVAAPPPPPGFGGMLLSPGLTGNYTPPSSCGALREANSRLDEDVDSVDTFNEWPDCLPSLDIEQQSSSGHSSGHSSGLSGGLSGGHSSGHVLSLTSPRCHSSIPLGTVTPTDCSTDDDIQFPQQTTTTTTTTAAASNLVHAAAAKHLQPQQPGTASESSHQLQSAPPRAPPPVNLKRVWIKDWLPVEFEGFPPAIADQFITAFSEEGLVSVQDLLIAHANGQLSHDFLKELDIGCRFGHYNRLISCLAAANENN